jgi:dihydrofolate reductase
MVMGRRTFDSMGALPGRRSIVVTRQPGWSAAGVEVAHSVPEALGAASDSEQVFVVGGGEIYRQAMEYAARLLVTEVDQSPEGSVTFPRIDPAEWVETAREVHPGFAWVTYERRR